MFRRLESVLATVAALALFALNDLRLLNSRPHAPDLAHGYTHSTFLRVLGDPEHAYLSSADLVVRWSLVALIIALSAWALADSVDRNAAARRK